MRGTQGVDARRGGPVVVYAVAGALDLHAAAQFTEGITRALGGGPAGIDVDLSKLDSIDSVGFSVFVTAHYQCLDAGVHLRFLHPSPLVTRLLRSSGLDQILHVEDAGALVSA